MEKQATEATAMSTTPPSASSSASFTAAVDDDDDFGTFSAYETAESNDIKSDDGSPDEDFEAHAPSALPAPPPPSAMMSSSLNEEEFFDASSEAADMNQSNDLSDENAQEEAAAEKSQLEVNLFGSVDDVAMTPDAFAAVESEGGINDNIISNATDSFRAFDGIADNSEGTCPESGENPPSETNSTDETHDTVSLERGASAFDSHAFSDIEEMTEAEQKFSTSGAIDVEGGAFPSGQSEPVDIVATTAIIASDDNFGELAEVSSLENAADEKSNIEDDVAFTSSLDHNAIEDFDRVDAQETKPTLEEEEAAQAPETSIDEAPTSVETSAEDEDSALEAAKNDSDAFGAFEETSPIELNYQSTAEIKSTGNELTEILDGVIETASTPLEGTTESTIAIEEGIGERLTNKNNPDAQDNSFGFSTFEAAVPVEETTANEIEKADVIFEEDTIPVESAVEETDSFGAFFVPTEEDTDAAHAEQNTPAEEDTDPANEKDVDFEDAAIEENDHSEEGQPSEVDAALIEEGNSPMETAIDESSHFGDFIAPVETDAAGIETDTSLAEGEIEESDFSDFGGFAAVSVVEDGALIEGGSAVAENDDFGDFSAPVGETPLAELDAALTEQDDGLMEKKVEENDDLGNFFAPAEVASALDTALVTPDEVESNNFEDFSSPSEESTCPAEAPANVSDEFGDFGGFSSPPELSPAIADGATFEDATEGADEDFDDFGDFSAPVEAETEANIEEGPGERNEFAQPDDDGFGEFGDFAAFEEAAPADTPAVSQQTAQDEEKSTVDDVPTSQLQSTQAVSLEEDEFGDFGDFEESDTVQETSGNNDPSRHVIVLNDNVRALFQKVFQLDNPVESEMGDSCTQLPFDVPMRTVIAPRKSDTKEKDDEKRTYKSEQEIKDITNYIKSLPTSPPSTILSEEKWYPYSQYIFQHDGTPYTEKSNPMSMAAPVPEVLSIELPTGFDASAFNPKTSSSTNGRFSEPPTQPVRPTATMVDFPSADAKMTEEEEKEAAEDDEFGKLSAAGKKFMEQLPDLSYMLQPTLSAVK